MCSRFHSSDPMRTDAIIAVLEYLARQTQGMPPLLSERLLCDYGCNPFIMLVGCVLSLRARDTATYPVCKVLFARACIAEQLAAMPIHELEYILRPIGFYHTKARVIQKLASVLIAEHAGEVPQGIEKLLQLPGVGRKTANFMLCYVEKTAALCVDVHVHRLANAFKWVATKSPELTEVALMQLIPPSWWCSVNVLLVTWGQQVCKSSRMSKTQKAAHDCICPCVIPMNKLLRLKGC